MNYSETINYLFNQLPMFQRTGPAAYKNNLDNTIKLAELYGNRHKMFKTVHVAGTNGKGSVAHMLAAVLQSAGYKTGLYTSPHLKDFRERIKVNGNLISEEKVVRWVETFIINNKLWKIEPSFFELTVALAFDFFAAEKVDIAIVEVGLGGRLDSTNIITPEVSVITNIGKDHTNLLGDTPELIAREKAGIIKPYVPVVIGTTQNETKDVFLQIAKQKKAPLFFADKIYYAGYSLLDMDGKQSLHVNKNKQIEYPDLKLDLSGMYQLKNVPAVLQSIDLLREKGFKIEKNNIYNGLANTVSLTGLFGRWQIIGHNPKIVCDTGHNFDGIKEVVTQIKNTAYQTLHFVFGTVADKNADDVLKLLPKNGVYYFTQAKLPRALNSAELLKQAQKFGLKGKSFNSVADAYDSARKQAHKNDLIVVGGSTFVVAEIL